MQEPISDSSLQFSVQDISADCPQLSAEGQSVALLTESLLNGSLSDNGSLDCAQLRNTGSMSDTNMQEPSPVTVRMIIFLHHDLTFNYAPRIPPLTGLPKHLQWIALALPDILPFNLTLGFCNNDQLQAFLDLPF